MKRNRSKPSKRLALAIALCAGMAPALAQRYAIADLGTIPGYANSYVWELTLNNNGTVGVYANNILNPNAFSGDVSYLWHAGTIFRLPSLPKATDTLVLALNDRYESVGYSGADALQVHAVIWKNGRVHDLGTLPGDDYSIAIDLNNFGVVVGDSFTAADATTNFFGGHHAVAWHDGHIRLLPSLPGGGPDDIAYAVNDEGQVVGQSGPDDAHVHAALWASHADVTDLGTLGGDASFAIGLNRKGQIVGGAQNADGNFRAFLWENGSMSNLGAIDDDVFSEAVSINARGQSVGISAASLTDLTTAKAILWEGSRMINLQAEISADSGWQLLGASSINERGQISGYGIHDGQYRAFLLSPR